MDYHREALFGIVSVAVLFVPTFVAIFIALSTRQQGREAREKRIASYRNSPESRLLMLND